MAGCCDTSWPSFSASSMSCCVSMGIGSFRWLRAWGSGSVPFSVGPVTIVQTPASHQAGEFVVKETGFLNRYHRQILLPQIGQSGQDRLAASHVLLVGCGALGCVLADQLVRAGVGSLRIVDRDVVELTNLQRQVLFDEEDARLGVPKAVAAAGRLGRVNSAGRIEAVV